jgi:hypothetical protein
MILVGCPATETHFMSTRGSSSPSTILLIIILVITFPLWIAIFGALIGVLGGVFGAVFGVFGALLGAFFTIIFLPFKILFGWGHWDHGHDWGWHGFHGHSMNGYVVLAIVLFVYLFYRGRNKQQ